MGHVCPWWIGYLLASPLRRLFQKPEKILFPYIKEGMTILEIGPGMGFFSIPMARMTGNNGRVICVDIQEKMLQGLANRAFKNNVGHIIETRLGKGNSFEIADMKGTIDFCLLFAVVHELPDIEALFQQISLAMKPGGKILLAEPKGHVSKSAFSKTLELARLHNLTVLEYPNIPRSLSVVLQKG